MAEGLMPQTDSIVEWDQLILRYLEGEDSVEMLEEIRKLLPDRRFQAKLAQYALDTVHLIEYIDQTASPAGGEVGLSRTSVNSNCLAEPERSTFFRSTRWPISRLATLSAGIATIGAILMLAFFLPGNDQRSGGLGAQASEANSFLCTMNDSMGYVYIGDEAADSFDGLGAGQTIRTEGALSSVRLVFPDGTAIQLTGDSALRLYVTKDQKQLYLDYGNATADVSPQPRGKPLMLYTSTAELEVVGTVFTVSDVKNSTELGVSEGVVMMKPRGGGESIAVSEGEFSEVRLAKILPPLEMVSPPNSWTEDFDKGLPEGWAQGKWVKNDKNGSSGGAITPPCVTPSLAGNGAPSYSDFFSIRSCEKWSSGLVRVLEDTELSYRIKMDRPQWYQVFLSVRGEPVQDSKWSWNYEYQEVSTTRWTDVEPGGWREIRVPLSSFKRIGGDPQQDHYDPFELRGGAAPPVGGLVVYVMFSTQTKDRGLEIDDITIGPAQPMQNLTTY